MTELPNFDPFTLCPDYRFVRVVSADGVFYDLVRKWGARAHVFSLQQSYPFAETVNRAAVPPCVFRDFTELDGPDRFHESRWKDGTQFLFPLEEKDDAYLK
ncbi:MAG: hypothetical protein IJG45_08340 [Oscillospiraceae bacterium]|nr:hypothetical protein [Oscillospiraceae bacterium]